MDLISFKKKFAEIYNCVLKNALNKDYRTNLVNNFVLRVVKAKEGFLSLEKFRARIFLGYWERQSS